MSNSSAPPALRKCLWYSDPGLSARGYSYKAPAAPEMQIFTQLENSVTKHYYYINGPDGPVALGIQTGGGSPVIYYLCKDHLGSITGIMNSSGNILEEYNYDVWGKRRNPADWSYSNVVTPTYTQHGFTGHEHSDMFNLINMGGEARRSNIYYSVFSP